MIRLGDQTLRFLCIAAALTCCTVVQAGVQAGAQTLTPERVVNGAALSSQHDPPLRIEVPQEARYVGADRWILYGIADCEVHLFVEADAAKAIKRYYWIQFEAMVPEKPDAKHVYSDPTLNLDGTEFQFRARFGPMNETGRPGSDLEHVMKLLRDNGYTVPAEMMNVRLVFLPDEMKRKELMIIYAEDLSPTGLTSAQLIKDGKVADQWAPIEKDLIERARKSITLHKMD